MNINELRQLDDLDPQTRRAVETIHALSEWRSHSWSYRTKEGDIAFETETGGTTWEDVESLLKSWEHHR